MAQLQPGTVLQNTYRVIRRIGQGGMGQVYEVEHSRLSNRYALKLLAHEAAADPEFLQRFRREAQIVSSLRHPHIVQVVDFDESADGRPYLVMELIEGEDLAARVERAGPLPLARVVEIVNQVAAALQTAHDQGVVHRDLKPENVLLMRVRDDQPEFVKLVDFGVSKLKHDSTRLTQKRTMLGTPHYMSPEQALAQDVDERSDQFALAAITYELLSGELAFAGDNVPAVVFQVAHGEPPRLADPAGWINPEVDGVLKRALSKTREERFPTVSGFARAFQQAAAGVGEDTLKQARRPLANTTRRIRAREVSFTRPIRHRRKIAAAALLGVAATGMIWALTRDGGPPAPARQVISAPGPRAEPPAGIPLPTAPAPIPPTPVPEPVAAPADARRPAAEKARPTPRRRPPKPEDRLYNDL